MPSIARNRKVGSLTVNELQNLIRQTIIELISSDYGLELKPEIKEELKESLKSRKIFSAKNVSRELGLKW